MTGYGAAEVDLPDGRVLTVEAKSENHRHLSPSVRLPRGWDTLQSVVLGEVKAILARGRVYVTVGCVAGSHSGPEFFPEVNEELASNYQLVLDDLAVKLDMEEELSLSTLAKLPGVLRLEKFKAESVTLVLPNPDLVQDCVREALLAVDEMRRKEGLQLERQLRDSIITIQRELKKIETIAPERLDRERDRLRERIRDLSELVEVDEDRLAREVAYLADKWDIAEEVTRLKSHIDLFLATLDSEERGKSGKRLGFVVQEMHREVNTIGSKANDTKISTSVVTVKEELEHLREQLENLE